MHYIAFVLHRILFFLLKVWFGFFPKGFVYFGHGIVTQRKDNYIERIHLPAEQLEDVILFWKKLGFEFISLQQLELMAKKQFKSSKPWVHFTFDDGYRNNLTEALPVFEKHQIPFTVFVSTNLVDTGRRFDTFNIRTSLMNTIDEVNLPYVEGFLAKGATREERIAYIRTSCRVFKRLGVQERLRFLEAVSNLMTKEEWSRKYEEFQSDQPMSQKELVLLSQHKLVSIGSHGVDHLIHNEYHHKEDCYREINDSKEWLERNVKISVDTFAFPNGGIGDFSKECLQLCKEAGYKMVFTTIESPISRDTSSFMVPRHFLSGSPRTILWWLLKN